MYVFWCRRCLGLGLKLVKEASDPVRNKKINPTLANFLILLDDFKPEPEPESEEEEEEENDEMDSEELGKCVVVVVHVFLENEWFY